MSGFRVPLAVPCLDGNADAYLTACLDTNYVSSVGPFVPRFEEAMASFVGAGHGVACSSGTAAIHLALVALGVCPGDEVLVSDLTFIASANPARYCAATVTLVDSERATWNLDPALVAEELDARARAGRRQPAAVVAVHLLGHPLHMEPLLDAAARHGVPVVEDAAEALGARWTAGRLAERDAGTAGTLGCFSFNGNKVMTTGGGGMVVTDDRRLAERARHLATQARVPAVGYEHDEVGFNYRLTNLACALGLAQLERLGWFLERKRAIAAVYDRAFTGLGGVELPPNQPWTSRSAWLYTLLLESPRTREAVRLALAVEGIEARPIWVPVHRQRPYRDAAVLGGGAVADDLAARALSLPSSVSLSEAEQADVISVARAVLEAG